MNSMGLHGTGFSVQNKMPFLFCHGSLAVPVLPSDRILPGVEFFWVSAISDSTAIRHVTVSSPLHRVTVITRGTLISKSKVIDLRYIILSHPHYISKSIFFIIE
jgi:hypothetical protein